MAGSKQEQDSHSSPTTSIDSNIQVSERFYPLNAEDGTEAVDLLPPKNERGGGAVSNRGTVSKDRLLPLEKQLIHTMNPQSIGRFPDSYHFKRMSDNVLHSELVKGCLYKVS